MLTTTLQQDMWMSVVFCVVVVVGSSVAAADTDTVVPRGDYCHQLNTKYRNKDWLRKLLVSEAWEDETCMRWLRKDGRELRVEVWGGGGAPRAAAALLNAVLSHALRYHTLFIPSHPDLCNLTERAYYGPVAAVAPSAPWPAIGCGGGERWLDYLISLTVRPAVPLTIHLFGYLPPEHQHTCARPASTWSFYTNVTSLAGCSFLKHAELPGILNNSCENCALLLARNVSGNDIKVIEEFKKRTKVNVFIIYYDEVGLREAITKLKHQNISFLFFYEDIWQGVEGIIQVQPPPRVNITEAYVYDLDTTASVGVGDGSIIKKSAPQIVEILERFQPKQNALREILNYEENLRISIDNAGCIWSLKNEKDFEYLSQSTTNAISRKYYVTVILCKQDGLRQYSELLSILKSVINELIREIDFGISYYYLDCTSVGDLVDRTNRESGKRNTIGVVVWGRIKGVKDLVKAAEETLPVIFAGPVPNEVRLGQASYSVTGNLGDLARAYRHFLYLSGWHRIAILSDDTSYSRSFMKCLNLKEELISREIVISTEDTIIAALESFRAADARIFLINANWTLANCIVCKALQLGIASTEKYSWIVRDGNVTQCHSHNTTDDINYYTIGMDWRGTSLPNGESRFTKHIKQKWIAGKLYQYLNSTKSQGPQFALPLGSSYLADAVLQLFFSFRSFYKSHPTYLYDLHGATSIKLFSKIIQNTHVEGVTQTLRLNSEHRVIEPLVFVDMWSGTKRRSLAVWQVMSDKVIEKWILSSDVFINNSQVYDGTYCKMLSSGDAFGPRCHDLTLLFFTVIFVTIFIAFLVARHKRIARLSYLHDLRELKHHIRIATILETYIVDRSSIKVLHEIGSGTFGKVYFAEMKICRQNTVFVAAKQPHGNSDTEEQHKFLQEAFILAPLKHENIIKLVGICHKDGPPLVLMEYALYLDLKRYLVERRQLAYDSGPDKVSDEISEETLTRLMRQAAAALHYLASKQLVHRDVRAANCLINRKRSLKLADFGMARQLNKDAEYATRRRAMFPILWMAPECLQHGVFSPASDVWALGVLLLEVVTLGGRPFGTCPPAHVFRHVIEGGHAPLPSDISVHTHRLLMWCWQREPARRPTAIQVQSYLTSNKDALTLSLISPSAPPRNIWSTTL